MNNTETLAKLNDIWNTYRQARNTGDKKKANQLLRNYIDVFKLQDPKDIKIFVDNICHSVWDNERMPGLNHPSETPDNNNIIQHPLFKEIIVPDLIKEYNNNSALHMRWIGQFEQFFYSDFATTQSFLNELNIAGHFDTRHFYEKSFSIHQDQKTLALLLDRMAQDLNYYTHEVPIGVLVEPDFLNKEIKTFKHYWQKCNSKNIWNQVLSKWELIAEHWTLFVQQKDQFDNFENYLKIHTIELD